MSNQTPEYDNVSSEQPPAGTVSPPPQNYPTQSPQAPQQSPGANNFVVGLTDLLGSIARLAKNQTIEAFQVARRSPLLWLVTFIIGALLVALLLPTMLGRLSGAAMSSFASVFGGGAVYFGMTAGAWFTTFLVTIGVLAAVMVLRAVALHVTFQVGGKPQAFRASLNLLAVAYSPQLPVMALILLLTLIPGSSWIMIVGAIGVFLWALFTLVTELLIYIGLNRTTGFSQSPLRPHIIATAIWMIAVVIIYFLVSLIMGEMTTNALGEML